VRRIPAILASISAFAISFVGTGLAYCIGGGNPIPKLFAAPFHLREPFNFMVQAGVAAAVFTALLQAVFPKLKFLTVMVVVTILVFVGVTLFGLWIAVIMAV